jgi:cytochrome oxidase assembly protein ShyY1
MYRFLARPKWILFTALMAILVVVMVNLAFWQLRRLDERKSFNREVRDRTSAPATPLVEVLAAHPDPSDAEWRQVTVTGVYETGAQVLIRDRSLNSVPGANVVTPLRLADGRFLTVQRGFLPVADVDPVAPAGTVNLVGRLRRTQRKHHSWEKADPPTGVLDKLNRVDVPRLDQQVDGDSVAPMYLEVTSSDPSDPNLALIPLPELSEGPHLGYAGQWFLFSATAILGWVLVVRKAASDRRKDAAKAARAAAVAGPTPEPGPTPEL